ncbi:serine/threonine-protein kinase Nek10-like [Octopus vulgaris]|uniref:Serine/threonine-protein kinase Nek10-like n=1 Tax=Octopus vulgaris TaxID=6645 RepID=A0AA36FFX2_OCTVU|nr:serine/threonine-protein kinase Nek10-like [Octopus vulgaris]
MSTSKRSTTTSESDLQVLKTLFDVVNASEINLQDFSEETNTKDIIESPTTSRHFSLEAQALEQFSRRYKNCRNFSHLSKYIDTIFSCLVKNRLCSWKWKQLIPPDNLLRLLVSLRIIMRDKTYRTLFFDLNGIKSSAEILKENVNRYLQYGETPYVREILKEVTNIFHKLSTCADQRKWLLAADVYQSLVLLISFPDLLLVHCSLHCLITLTKSPEACKLVGHLNVVEILLKIIQEYDDTSKNQLHNSNMELQWQVIWCLVNLSEDANARHEIKQMGGIPLLLSLLQEKITETPSLENGTTSGKEAEIQDLNTFELSCSLKSACCAALTELVLDDTNAHQIVLANGIYILGQLILPRPMNDRRKDLAIGILQKNSFRTLRFLFSVERNRRLFKRLLPAELYEMFIDVGHYNKKLDNYEFLGKKINNLPPETIADIKTNLQETDQNKKPNHYIGDYAVFELLGSGGFGSVYKVKKTTGQSFLALKEINLQNPVFGKNETERSNSIGKMISELNIIREQLRHQNIVRYYKTFQLGQKLYIVMELIDGAPLKEHFNSLKEKRCLFEESRIWNILIQMLLALRYLHKEKGIVHRDLTPNNIMIGEQDRVTVTDFGLAKHNQGKQREMTSVVGTILYSCPEVIKNDPYGEKTDIWALGCIVYEMCTLQPPFFSTNMLTLAKKIVEADYKPVPEKLYSAQLLQVISSCLSVKPEDRPDVYQLTALISDKMLLHIDCLQLRENSLKRKLEKERSRTQKYFFEAVSNKQNYQKLFVASQEHLNHFSDPASSSREEKEGDYDYSVELDYNDNKGNSKKEPFSFDNVTETEDQDAWTSEEELYLSYHGNSSALKKPTTDDISEAEMDSCNGIDAVSFSSSSSASADAAQTPDSITVGCVTEDNVRRSRDDDNIGNTPHHPSTPARTVQKGPEKQQQTDKPAQLSLVIPNTDTTIGYCSPNGLVPTSCSSAENGHFGVLKLDDSRNNQNYSRSSPNNLRVQRPSNSYSVSTSTATVTISPSRVRQISDPILQMLHPLHKIIYITQLPPPLQPNGRRRIIEQFKRALFSPQSTSDSLKKELNKLLTGSQEVIDLAYGLSDSGFQRPSCLTLLEPSNMDDNDPNNMSGNSDLLDNRTGVTYEQMQTLIESALMDSGYYCIPSFVNNTDTDSLQKNFS